MYQREREGEVSVRNTVTGEQNIHPGVSSWKTYKDWVKRGGVTGKARPRVDDDRDMVTGVILTMVDGFHLENIEIGGVSYRADHTARSYYSNMLLLFMKAINLPDLEMPRVDGVVEYATQEKVVEVLAAITLRDSAIIKFGRVNMDLVKKSNDPGAYVIPGKPSVK
jgi:hypothetical protein